jgi:hypothetical protein
VKIERISHRDWHEVYRCSAGPLELIVVTSMGPRVMALHFNHGENLLYEDATDFKVGAWHLCGGHRLTMAPESEASYAPDDQPCRVEVKGHRLLVHQRLDDGLLRLLEITRGADGSGFKLRHVLRNCRPEPWHGAAWAITCVPLSGKVVVPKCKTPARFWTPPHGNYADASSGQWQCAQDYFVVLPQGRKGKVGLRSQAGWLAWLRPDCTFVIRGREWVPHATYPDDGCNIEVYTCASYLELETLGPLTMLLPGQELVHVEEWRVLPRAFLPMEWPAIDELTRPARIPIPAEGISA